MVEGELHCMRRPLQALLVLASCLNLHAQLVQIVRNQINQGDFREAQKILADFKSRYGATPEMLEAHSWLGRGALAAKQLDQADAFAAETYKMCEQALAHRAMDAEPSLPIAIGASIEVQGQSLAQRGQRSEAVAYLNSQLKRYYKTSIRARLQKNLNLLTLEGKPAPPLEMKEFLTNSKLAGGMGQLHGKPTVIFFWAHWCADCKQQGPILNRLQQEYPSLQVLAPTQPYGYVAGGVDAPRQAELPYMRQVFAQYYASLAPVAVPVSEENFRAYGVSTTPTVVLLDKAGLVRVYHPGMMSYDELKAAMRRVMN